jgi:hypothetical protein
VLKGADKTTAEMPLHHSPHLGSLPDLLRSVLPPEAYQHNCDALFNAHNHSRHLLFSLHPLFFFMHCAAEKRAPVL